MAFTEAQRLDIRGFLGWADRFFQRDSRLEHAMNAAEQRPDTVVKITVLLASLNTLWVTTIPGAYERLQVMKLGTITLSGSGELSELRKEGRRLSGALASLLGVMVRHDVWSSTGPQSFAGGIGCAGNYFPHG